MASNASLLAVSALAGARSAARLSLAALLGQAAFVLGGLAVARAPAAAYRSLAMAPLLAARNAQTYTRLVHRGREREWVRTERE